LKVAFTARGKVMSTIITIGAIVIFLVVIGYALNLIKALFKSK
jgi:hypothetical protein